MWIALMLGVITGFLAGLLPGIHTNLIAVIVASFQADVWLSTVFLVSVAISRSVADAIPTVFIGASDDVMSLLPGHRLLKKGQGLEAVKFSVVGSVLGVLAGIFLAPLLLILFPFLFNFISPILFWLLFLLILYLLRDSWWSLLVFCLAGALGILSLDSVSEPLFPLLSGLFGASGLLMSIFSGNELPEQNETDVKVPARLIVGGVFTGVISGSFVTLFPGLGPNQAAALFSGKTNPSRFLVMTGALGTIDVLISLVTFFSIGKARNGAVVIIERLLGDLSFSSVVFLIAVSCVAVGISAIFTIFISRGYSKLIVLVNYSILSACILLFLLTASYLLSGWLGVLIFLTATAIGLIAPIKNLPRSHAMGCLLLPTLILLW